MSNVVSLSARLGLVCLGLVCLILVCCSSARAEFIVDDFGEPDEVRVPVIHLNDPDPTVVQTPEVLPDDPILGGERDLLVDVIGVSTPGSFVGEIGGGSFKFSSSSPGTLATLQYDGLDSDPSDGLVNSEGLGGLNLAALGSILRLEFSRIEGGLMQATDVEIEVHSPLGDAMLIGAIADGTSVVFSAPFAGFSNPGAFSDVTSVEFRINPGGVPDVGFQLDAITVTGTAIPEPSTLLLLLAGGLIAMISRIRPCRRTTAS